jgi:hypothetical protein
LPSFATPWFCPEANMTWLHDKKHKMRSKFM